MKISEIYSKFGIPPNLQEHMFRVFGVVCFLEKSWRGENLDWVQIKKLALLHDLGNVVKFDLDKHPEFLGKVEQANVGFWKEQQKKVIDKYGKDDHEVTNKMLEELGIDKEMIKIILSKSFGESLATRDSNNWPLKILYYADLRTLPLGIGTLEARMQDVRNRMPKYTSRPDFEDLVHACKDLELQLQSNLSKSVFEINDKVINKFISKAEVFDL